MLLTAEIAPGKRVSAEGDPPRGLDKLKVVRSVLPAVTHIDHSARIQTVSRDDHPRYHRLIERFYEKTGCPAIVNTSFNVRGEPIVCTPDDAYRCFAGTNMDYLALGSWLIDRKEQGLPPADPERRKGFPLHADLTAMVVDSRSRRHAGGVARRQRHTPDTRVGAAAADRQLSAALMQRRIVLAHSNTRTISPLTFQGAHIQ